MWFVCGAWCVSGGVVSGGVVCVVGVVAVFFTREFFGERLKKCFQGFKRSNYFLNFFKNFDVPLNHIVVVLARV